MCDLNRMYNFSILVNARLDVDESALIFSIIDWTTLVLQKNAHAVNRYGLVYSNAKWVIPCLNEEHPSYFGDFKNYYKLCKWQLSKRA